MKPKNLAWLYKLWTSLDPGPACAACPWKHLAIFLRSAQGLVTSPRPFASSAQGQVGNSTSHSSFLHRCSEPGWGVLRLKVVPSYLPVGDEKCKLFPHLPSVYCSLLGPASYFQYPESGNSEPIILLRKDESYPTGCPLSVEWSEN